MGEVYPDNDLFALWTRLGIEAVERFADRTGDTFVLHKSELQTMCGRGKHRSDVARKSLERLAEVSPMSWERSGDVYRIHLPNFAKKQGFGKRNGESMGDPPTTTPTTTPTTPIGVADEPATSPKREKQKFSEEVVRLAQLWASLRAGSGGPSRPSKSALETWRNDIRLMIERDGKPAAQLEAVIRFLYGENLKREFPFVCQSPRNLRRDGCEKFDRIVSAMKEPAPGTASRGVPGGTKGVRNTDQFEKLIGGPG